MEQVINAQDRNNAFFKFLIFFSLTVALIVGAVYFDTLIPKYENKKSRSMLATYEKENNDQTSFVDAMEKALAFNDTLFQKGRLDPIVEQKIKNQIEIMQQPKYQESKLYGKSNVNILLFIHNYTEKNKSLINLKEDLKEVEQLKTDLEQAKLDLKDAKNDLKDANKSLQVYINGANSGLGRQ